MNTQHKYSLLQIENVTKTTAVVSMFTMCVFFMLLVYGNVSDLVLFILNGLLTIINELDLFRLDMCYVIIAVGNCIYHVWIAQQIRYAWAIHVYYTCFVLYMITYVLIIMTKSPKKRKMFQSFLNLMGVCSNLWMYSNLLYCRVFLP